MNFCLLAICSRFFFSFFFSSKILSWAMWLGKYSICTVQHSMIAYREHTTRNCQIFEIRAGRVLIWLSNHCAENTHDTDRQAPAGDSLSLQLLLRSGDASQTVLSITHSEVSQVGFSSSLSSYCSNIPFTDKLRLVQMLLILRGWLLRHCATPT